MIKRKLSNGKTHYYPNHVERNHSAHIRFLKELKFLQDKFEYEFSRQNLTNLEKKLIISNFINNNQSPTIPHDRKNCAAKILTNKLVKINKTNKFRKFGLLITSSLIASFATASIFINIAI